ncbi:hypothetical protein BO70DRAFT_11041 [Aspergillus heteromorphus CBS 117.55]|uniref:Uncharacterized protein n=1 Tax=Aspergillus heteromorphus CBS 117.55 TaxID=1448321 RepID=A0A317X6D3_9EURO|nr:uncharacterized protein BO70DRAFT_11041 [Aspergillus heteromorphus CBS 117.55]PWY92458.1 hypothetical protein BO70DRAFT_11041 [Aspergillus heteromorphus CBS 117.55]
MSILSIYLSIYLPTLHTHSVTSTRRLSSFCLSWMSTLHLRYTKRTREYPERERERDRMRARDTPCCAMPHTPRTRFPNQPPLIISIITNLPSNLLLLARSPPTIARPSTTDPIFSNPTPLPSFLPNFSSSISPCPTTLNPQSLLLAVLSHPIHSNDVYYATLRYAKETKSNSLPTYLPTYLST